MEPFKPRDKHGPEYYIQNRWVDFLEAKGWHIERMSGGQLIGGATVKGIPDLSICRPDYGERWVDIKVYGEYSFTKTQKWKWPEWEAAGRKIWILGATSPEACTKEHMLSEYHILFDPPNWRNFWRNSWGEKLDIDKMLEDLNNAH